jgi:C1A family cysteine protease
MKRKIKNYGWVPDLPDHRDFLYAVPARTKRTLPKAVSLRAQCPKPIYDQGELGSCTGNAIAAALEFDQIRQKLPESTPSRLFIYYNERAVEGAVQADSGAQIRDGIKVVASLGACPETIWPYDVAKFATKPPVAAYRSAAARKVTLYRRIAQDLDQFRSCLASGYPFVFGFTVYESFESDAVASKGVLNMPEPHEKAVGGHAVLAVGYDDSTRRFLIRNSWGADWGDGGYFTMPYEYLEHQDLTDDFWTITTVAA